MAEPSAKTIRAPSNNKEITIGISHHFLRTLRNCQNSAIIDNLLTVAPGISIQILRHYTLNTATGQGFF